MNRIVGLVLFGILFLCGALYMKGLNGPLLLDDISVLVPLMELDPAQWRLWISDQLITNRGALGRPVSMVSFFFNVVNHGDDIRYWNGVNVLLHLGTGLLVFWLTLFLARIGEGNKELMRARWLALLLAGIWILHPIHVSTVLYTVQRMAQLSTLFILAGLLAYVAGRQCQLRQERGGGLLIGLAFLLCFPLAVLSKENGVLFPVFAALVEAIFFRLQGNAGTRRALLALFTVFLLLPAIAGIVLVALQFETRVLAGYISRDFTLTERVLTEFRVLAFYLYQLLVPVPGNMGFFHDDFPVSKGLLAPVTTLLSMILLLALLIMAWLLRCKAPLVSFGLFFFYVAHLLESTIFPLELVFEHRNYLASYGILLALCAGLFRLLHRPRIMVAAGTTALLVLSFLTGARASTWGSYESFYSFVYYAHPYSKRVVTLFANTNAEAGQFQEAFRLLDRFDDAGFSINRLYVMCQRDGYLSDESIHKIAGGLKGVVEHHAVNGLFKLANQGLDDQCVFSSTAWQALLDAVFHLPVSDNNKGKLMMYRAHFYKREGELENAISTLNEVYELTPDSPIPLFLATEWLIASGDPERAQVIYEKAIAVVADSRKNYAEYTGRIEVLLDTGSR